MGFIREQGIYDSAQLHTGIGAKAKAVFFQVGNGASLSQLTSGTSTSYTKEDYHTNNVLNGQTENGQSLEVLGIDIFADITDVHVLKQLFIDSQAVFKMKIGKDDVLQIPLMRLFDLKIASLTGFSDGQAAAKGQKLSIGFKALDSFFKFNRSPLIIGELTTFKCEIIFEKAVIFKSFDSDYGTLAVNGAFVTPFNLFCNLICDETIS